MSALLPSQDRRPTEAPVLVIPAQRSAPPPQTPAPAVMPRPRPAAVWGVVAGMAAGGARAPARPSDRPRAGGRPRPDDHLAAHARAARSLRRHRVRARPRAHGL